MLRWVDRALRFGLLIVGICLLIWLPTTWRHAITASSVDHHSIVHGVNGAVSFSLRDRHPFPTQIKTHPSEVFRRGRALWPSFTLHTADVAYSGSYIATLQLPIWLLAFMCLAWPVTSFFLARRRRKGRGFEVEARPGAAVPPPES